MKVFAFLMILVCLVMADTPFQRYGKISVQEIDGLSYLVDQAGNPTQLRGMSTHGIQWFDQLYTRNSIKSLAQYWKADIIRISLYAREGGYESRPAYFTRRVDELVELATEYGLYVIIDWHQLTPGDPNADKANAKIFFNHMAQKHGSKENVIFEICNEPNDVSGGDWLEAESKYEVTWIDHILPYAEEIIPIIREHSGNIIIVGTPKWAARPHHVLEAPLDDPNVMYSLHFYANSHTYKQGDDEWFYMDNLRKAIEGGLAVFVTEFGTQKYCGDLENDFVASQHWLDSLAKYHISWCNWNYSDDSRSGAVFKQGSVNGWSSAADFANKNNMKEAGKWIMDRIQDPRTPVGKPYRVITDISEGVSLNPSGNIAIAEGGSRTVQISPQPGYRITDVKINGISKGAISSYTFTNMRGDSTLAVFASPSNRELLKNGSFSNGVSDWTFNNWGDGTAGTGSVSGGEYTFSTTVAGSDI